MIDINDILSISSGEQFESAALELFAFQSRNCPPYAEYVKALGIDPGKVSSTAQIPFMPIEIFKTRKVYCGTGEPSIVFTSSTTGGGEPSRHYMRDVSDYEAAFRTAFNYFYGDPAVWGFYALLPNYLERTGSSLVYMAQDLIKLGHGGFYLDNYEKLLEDIARNTRPKILLGVSYALLDLAEKYSPDLSGVVVMETGGMKGRREELPKQQFHDILCKAFNVKTIHSEYGMAELTSQAYSCGKGLFSAPPWMRFTIRDLNDPFETLGQGRAGGINITDLANISSCAFIQTQDIGIIDSQGRFSVVGRADRSEIRGCNLLVQ